MRALYRKYRPTKLADVIGQEQVTRPLQAALESGKVSHAYLFTGPRGCGKTSVARIFAHAVNQFDYQIEDSYVDIIEIDAASNTGVDNIRDLREKAIVAPVVGKYKVYIIDEVHMLSKAAFNALLKTIEEPPESVIFIMATTDAYKVPVTITSRAQVYNFNLAAPNIMLEHLKVIARREKINILDDALEIIVKRGGGSFRDSISLLDQISTLSTESITKDMVLSALGLPEDELITNLLAAYEEKDTAAITELLKNELNNGTKAEMLAESLISHIVAKPEQSSLPLLKKLTDVKPPFAEAKILLAFLDGETKKPSKTGLLIKNPIKSQSTKIAQDESSNSLVTTDSQSQNATTTNTAQVIGKFNWSDYVKKVKETNSAIGNILSKTFHEVAGNTLHLYTERKAHCVILSSVNNRAILESFLPDGFKVEIENDSARVSKNSKLSKISDIMGEITEVNSDGIPFEL